MTSAKSALYVCLLLAVSVACILAIDGNKSIAAETAANAMLTLTKSGSGQGIVKSIPAGINCGVDCSEAGAQYNYESKVRLTAKSDLYSTFLGWGGACQDMGTKPTCAITMDSGKSVTAAFGLPEISISLSGHDFGSVALKRSSNPMSFMIHNSGDGNLKIGSIQITGNDKKMFKSAAGKGHVVPPESDYEFSVTFKPTSPGLKTAVLQIGSNDPGASPTEVPISGFACTDKPKVTICGGSVEQCLNVNCSWNLQEKAVSDPSFCDGSIVRLPDGRHRMYGNSATGIESWISGNGIAFEKEPGFRLISPGGFLPFVVTLSDNRFRMYYADQSVAVGYAGARAIKSAISTGGLDFVIEDGDRLTYLDSAYESGGIRGAKVLALKDGTYRMYYVAINDNVSRVLSAVSPDGLNWTREQGVRIDPQILCPANPDIGPSDPFVDSNGIIHQYIWTVKCKNKSWQGVVSGLFDFTSVDGLTFSMGSDPIVSGYYFKNTYTRKPDDPGVRADNAPVIMTPDGLRAYLYLYCPRFDLPQCADWPEMGYYSILNANIK
jgi:hypothetical protein